jgi:hypothetical protein
MNETKILLIEEKTEMETNYTMLKHFLNTDKFKSMGELDKSLIEAQLSTMDEYLLSLNRKIESIDGSSKNKGYKELTVDLIPDGCRYAAIDKDNTAYGFRFKPGLDTDCCDTWLTEAFDQEILIGNDFHTNNWTESLIKLPDYDEKLTADDIPKGYNYAAVDFDGTAHVFVNLPILNEKEGHWYVTDNDYYVYLGDFNASDWENSLVKK